MKQCPECGRGYDLTMSFCLDDGSELLYGPASGSAAADEPATAILHTTDAVGDAPTRAQRHTTEQTAVLPSGIIEMPKRRHDKRLLAVPIVLAIIVLGGFFGYRYFAPTSSKQIESIAVMPFVNDSGNADAEYLSDGMTETLIRSLSQLPNLNVKARSSVFRYKGKDIDAKTIGKELGVQAILNGRVIQHGDQLTLSLELIDPQTENVIWTDQYDRKSSDLVSLQNEIARDVSNKLRIKLSGADQQKLAQNYTNDPEAYRLYLQGRFYWNNSTASEVDKAVGFFKQSIEKDPNFALGYVGLADSNEDYDRLSKKEYIRRALDIDDNLPEAHASLGYQYMLDYNWVACERELKRAVELDPNYAQAYAWNGARLMMIGKYDESLASIRQALLLDPTANSPNFYLGVCLAVSGRHDEAIQQFKKLIDMDPAFPWPHSFLSRVYVWTGDHAGAVEERAKSQELDGKPEYGKLLRDSFAAGAGMD
ncbi:MAG: tetratricopeptide repeat protein, partial [Candidatus Binatia bacterium]